MFVDWLNEGPLAIPSSPSPDSSPFSPFTGTRILAPPTEGPLKCHTSRNFLGQEGFASSTWQRGTPDGEV